MSPFSFKADQKLTDVLKRQNFTLSAEVIPPRNGTEQSVVLSQIERLIGAGAQFLAVTKGAGGSLRGGTLPIAQTIKEQFNVPCIAHFTCRDLTPHEVENLLMDHHYFGIRNILALRGDPPDGQKDGQNDGQPDWKPKDGRYNYAYELIKQIKALNAGAYLGRPGGPEVSSQDPTDFCIGAAAYPEHPIEAERLRFYRMKVEAGAHFGITDMLFDADIYARFRDHCHKNGVRAPLLPGTRVLKTKVQAEKMAKKFKVSVPAKLMDALSDTDGQEAVERGVELFLELTRRLRSLGAPGIHLFVISDTESAARALRGCAAGV